MEPIAIIGIGCRFPGGTGPIGYWRMLRDGVDAVREVPADRWDLQACCDPDPTVPGKITTRWGAFLDQVDQFDPHFFGMSEEEAVRTDPQQRLLLELAWEALEDAGQLPERLAGSSTGVFVGIAWGDYGRAQLGAHARIDRHTNTGSLLCIAANRISYTFDFRGPSVALDTGCSSALVAVHLACQSLWLGDATLALAGGVNLIMSSEITIGLSKSGVLSPDGRCRPFDARANGYVRGEGAGLVVLKPLARAVADRDRIYAVIRGSAINQDGLTNGLTAPNRWAQEAVLREAYRRAGIAPGQVQYIEAHGTGTPIGDLIESSALGSVLAPGRTPGRACAVGSVKSNIGHVETAAGAAALIKAALALKHRAIPPSLHFEKPNPHINFDKLRLRVPTMLQPWPMDCGPLCAGVSAFSFGGTNAHIVLTEAPQNNVASAKELSAYLLPLSARTADALRSLVRACRDFLSPGGDGADLLLGDLCYTASVRRTHHTHRLAITAPSREKMLAHLGGAVQGQPPALHSALGQQAGLYVRGQAVDWDRLYPTGGRCVSLPAYPWQRKRYWLDFSV